MDVGRGKTKGLRFGVDTGGTFTDLVIEGLPGGIRAYKRPTTPEDPARGLLAAIGAAADDLGLGRDELLGRGEMLIFGTTRATNAIIERKTARTALLLTAGHPDILTLREGGDRPAGLYDWSHEFYRPHVPRNLTWEVPERIGASGEVVRPLDPVGTKGLLEAVRGANIESVAVCLLWSIVNPEHELAVGELLDEVLPGVPYTLSHQVNPSIREYRRASSAALDASLKPLMSGFLGDLEARLNGAGFGGRLLVMTSSGGVLDAEAVRAKPIHSIGSGPAAAPVAGRHFAQLDVETDTAIVTDAGGTSYDISLVRDGEIPWTRETTVGEGRYKMMTGFPSVDARSIGAGGGSIAWVDEGGMLHVGPRSAGAVPGPACYGTGGLEPTVTDACVELGFIDSDFFLGGEMELDPRLSTEAIENHVAGPLGLSTEDAAAAIFELAIEHMADAIEEIALVQGVDPTEAVTIAGGGGGGLYAGAIGRRAGCGLVVIPPVAAALSAAGTILSDLQGDFLVTRLCLTDRFDYAEANSAIDELKAQCDAFIASVGEGTAEITFRVEARYPNQIWEIEVDLPGERFEDIADVERFRQAFHSAHERLFTFSDEESPVELVAWHARARVRLGTRIDMAAGSDGGSTHTESRPVRFPGLERQETPFHRLESLPAGTAISGPAVIVSALTTVVVEPGAQIERAPSGSLLLRPAAATTSLTNGKAVDRANIG